MARPNHEARNRIISEALAAGESAAKLAEEYDITYSHVYRVAKAAAVTERPDTYAAGVDGRLFGELASSGLRRYGGSVDDEYDRRLKSLRKRVALYREMSDDPTVASMLQAIRMLLRRLAWSVVTDGETSADQQATEFVATCMDDMSQSWSDTIDQAIGGMLTNGFQPAEIVYKRRKAGQSKYNDGRIGWRKYTFVAAETLAPGNEWVFDEHGGLQGFRQQIPTSGQIVEVPIDKAVLFRASNEKGNPEGRSLLRPVFIPWYNKKNLEEIEAISAERMGAGFPVVYAGADVAKDLSNANSDAVKLRDMVINLRVDELMGAYIPYAKMGAGAKEGQGVLLELISPPSRGAVDFHQTITRYEQRMTMVGLAQFVHLGMNQVGARALGESSTDFFTLAVEAWADSLADTLTRYAVERLVGLNAFPGLTAMPRIAHERVGRIGLSDVANYINTLHNAALLTPSVELEKHLRELADIPTDVDVLRDRYERGPVELASAEAFADVRGAGHAGGRTREVQATNEYQRRLEQAYARWADRAAEKLETTDDRDELILALVAELEAELIRLGREALPEAVTIGLGGAPMSADMAEHLASSLRENERLIRESLIPALVSKLREAFGDEDVQVALGAGAGVVALRGVLATLEGRVASYAGAYWASSNIVAGLAMSEAGKRVRWVRDALAKHCDSCLEFGNRTYESHEDMLAATGGVTPANGTDCGPNCRCHLEPA